MIGAVRSRWLSWALAGVLALAVTAALVLVNVIASDHPARIDLTVGGRHRVSPRTDALLDSLGGNYEIVLGLDPRQADRRSLDHARDVLDAFARRSDRVGFTELDLGSSAGIGQADALIARIADERGAILDERAALLTTAIDELDSGATYFEQLATGLAGVRDAIPADAPGSANNRAYFDQRAAVARVGARELHELVEPLRAELTEGSLPGGLTDSNAMLEPARASLNGLLGQLVTLASDLDQFANAEAMPGAARDAAVPWAKSLRGRRDRVSVVADRMDRAKPLSLVDAARALQTGQTLLVIGPPNEGVRAIDLLELLPHSDALERAGVTAGVILGQRAEQLVFTALATLARPDRPIVVLVHAEAQAGVLDSGPLFTDLRRRLGTRGIDVAEWPVAVEADHPDLGAYEGDRDRPVVYVTLTPDSTGGSRGDSAQSGAARAGMLGATVSRLIARGEPVLVSANPSIFPTYGDPDPVVAPLERFFGLTVRTGTPLLAQHAGPRGAVVSTETRVVPRGDAHAIASAASGLPTLLPWAVGIDAAAREGVTSAELLAIEDTSAVWAESSWLGYWQTPRNQRGVVGVVPEFTEGDDVRRDRWVVGVAAERSDTPDGRPARLVVVGSNGWMLDPIAARRDEVVDGRSPLAFPGNAELFEAAVLWLAEQDELIAPSGEARPVALVQISGAQKRVLSWVLLAGLPGLILLGGVVHRVVRG